MQCCRWNQSLAAVRLSVAQSASCLKPCLQTYKLLTGVHSEHGASQNTHLEALLAVVVPAGTATLTQRMR